VNKHDIALRIEVDDKSYRIEVPEALIDEGADFFARMDGDMDNGWQMSRWWVPCPDETQRCQIVTDKLLTALTTEDKDYAVLMCAYVLRTKPLTKCIRVNTDGEIQGNEFSEV
jgi:hypothetical protein